MSDITFQTRLASLIGMPADAPDEALLTKVQELSKNSALRTPITEREGKIHGIMAAANCSRDQAIHVVAQQETEDKARKDAEEAAKKGKK